MSTLVISPHLDDAVFSLGRLIGNRSGVHVLTVHGGGNDVRTAEEAEALAILGATGHTWAYGSDESIPDLPDLLTGLGAFDQVLVPLGIYHPDHVALAEACRHVRWPSTVGIYEDLPYRVWWPDQAYHRRRIWGLPAEGEPEVQAGDADLKRRAVECYRSQLSDDLREVLYVPERVWWL